jgi:hypothetical protein
LISSAAEPAKSRPPELKVLERLVGTWNSESVSRVSEWTPAEARAKGFLTREWVLDGQFLQEKGKHSNGDSIVMFSYDVQKKMYRSWFFTSDGNTTETQGLWDESAKILTFSSDLNGLKNTSTIKFIDEDTHQWTAVVKDTKGKVFYDGEGKCTRRK